MIPRGAVDTYGSTVRMLSTQKKKKRASPALFVRRVARYHFLVWLCTRSKGGNFVPSAAMQMSAAPKSEKKKLQSSISFAWIVLAPVFSAGMRFDESCGSKGT